MVMGPQRRYHPRHPLARQLPLTSASSPHPVCSLTPSILFLITAVLPKIPHSNCCKRVPNRSLRPRRGRFGTLLQQLECGIFERTAVLCRLPLPHPRLTPPPPPPPPRAPPCATLSRGVCPPPLFATRSPRPRPTRSSPLPPAPPPTSCPAAALAAAQWWHPGRRHLSTRRRRKGAGAGGRTARTAATACAVAREAEGAPLPLLVGPRAEALARQPAGKTAPLARGGGVSEARDGRAGCGSAQSSVR